MLGGNPEPEKYDFVIGNPPYIKMPKDAPEATAMPEVHSFIRSILSREKCNFLFRKCMSMW